MSERKDHYADGTLYLVPTSMTVEPRSESLRTHVMFETVEGPTVHIYLPRSIEDRLRAGLNRKEA